MEDELVFPDVLREPRPREDVECDRPAHKFFEELRQLLPRDVPVQRVVGAGFHDEDLVAGAQRPDGLGPLEEGGDVPLVLRHEDGEGGERDLGRQHLVYLPEDLGVDDHKLRQLAEDGEHRQDPVRRDRDHPTVPVQELPGHLHLRQDEPPLRRLDVLRHDQHDEPPLLHQMGGEEGNFKVPAGVFDEKFLESPHLLRPARVQRDGGDREGEGGSFLPVKAVEDADGADLLRLKHGEVAPLLLKIRFMGRDDQNGEVGLAHDLPGFLGAQAPELGRIVQPGGVDQNDRADGEQLHRFVDRVGRRARNGRNDRDLLPGELV